VIVGSLLLPLVGLIAYITTPYFIDWLIGEAASGRHGYVFLVIFLYPVIMPLYWLSMVGVDWYFKRQMTL
jgi:hypothetical protein